MLTMVKNKILETIKRLDLDLSGKTVLTEAATGAYIVTPIIAVLAGAEVYAYTKSTKCGSVEQVKKQIYSTLEKFEIIDPLLHVIDFLTPEIILKADIITNSGHLRPLNEDKLKYAKSSVVIPLMYEAWELRKTDLDIEYCRKKNIKVGSTNERHPDVDVFNFLGDIALKMIFDAGLCLYKNKFILICNNDFGPFIASTLSRVSKLAVCDLEERREKYKNLDITWIGNFPDFEIPAEYSNAEAVLFSAYPFNKEWIGDNLTIDIKKLKNQLKNPFILRFAGDINIESCKKNKVAYYPEKVESGHQGILPSSVGFDPIIRLQSAGLKVGELLHKNETNFKGLRLLDFIN